MVALAVVPLITLAAVASGLPIWLQGGLIGLQILLLWRGLTPAAAEPPPAPGGLRLERADVQRRLAADQQRAGVQGAALAIRIDDSRRLRQLNGEDAFAALSAALERRLTQCLRSQDSFCPLDSDGFGVALAAQSGLTLGGVLAICQRLQGSLAQPVTLGGLTLWPSLSIGFATSARAAALNGLDLLQAAEVAAEKALQAGPGGLRSYAVVDFPALLTGDRVAELRAALESGEICAFFQPQIRTADGRVSGIEALARWRHPQRGLISPAEFLPQIESAGLASRLTERILRDSLATLAAMDTAGLEIPAVAVNLSAEDLRNPRLADIIAWELDRFDLAPRRLVVEILETVVAHGDDDIAVRTIARLAGMGCGIDLDDFGTGHASIANLRRFAVGRIKIDRSFVTRLHLEEDRRRMVAAILLMAGQLGLDTLAEGVEAAEEQVLLAQLGCGHVQGFGIARPMAGDDLPGWLRAHGAALAAGEPVCDPPASRPDAAQTGA